jgi:hypothetical protein
MEAWQCLGYGEEGFLLSGELRLYTYCKVLCYCRGMGMVLLWTILGAGLSAHGSAFSGDQHSVFGKNQ